MPVKAYSTMVEEPLVVEKRRVLAQPIIAVPSPLSVNVGIPVIPADIRPLPKLGVGRLVSKLPSTAGSLADPFSLTIWFALVPVLIVITGEEVGEETEASALAELTLVTVPPPVQTTAKSQLPRTDEPLIVFMLTPETSVGCFVDREAFVSTGKLSIFEPSIRRSVPTVLNVIF